ncbi:MAG: ParB/RepB/Spo0J family partition protein [Ruminococcaceae bacterium]|nr:ParB/RepB/Spo0J family partition protein [Oscillospiraceae bacterium]
MQTESAGKIVLIRCNKINPSKLKFNSFGGNITELSESIRKHGFMQPLNVRPLNYGMYEIISGNRRLSAAKLAGISSVPCIITDTDEKTAAKMNFIENSFRNKYSVFKEADIIKMLILNYEFGIDEVSDMIFCENSEIISKLRILHFSRENRIKAENSGLSFKQCKSLLKLENTEFFNDTLNEIIREKLNDLQTEEYVDKILKNLHNTVIFKDIKLFTNTISNAVEKMKSAGVKVIYDKQEDNEKISFSIIIPKSTNNAIKSQ